MAYTEADQTKILNRWEDEVQKCRDNEIREEEKLRKEKSNPSKVRPFVGVT